MAKRSKKDGRRAPAPAPTVASRPATPPWALATLLALVAIALYLPSWHYGFVGDDAMVTWNNAWTRQGLSALPATVTHSLYYGSVPENSGLYRPVAGAYYVLIGALVGMGATGFHVVNLLLYGLNTALVFLFVLELEEGATGIAVVAALIFLVHPIHTEVVNNIKSADEMLCLAGLLVAAIAWLHGARRGAARSRWVSVLAFAWAAGSKETALPMIVTLPALWYFFRGRSVRESLVAAWPFLLVALVYLGAREAAFSHEESGTTVTLLNNSLLATADPATRLASALSYVARYAWMLVWPHPLSFDYTYNAIASRSFAAPSVWVALLVLAGLAAVLLAGWRRRWPEAFAVLWIAAGMVLVVNLVMLISTNFGERLLYTPSVMFAFAVARLLARAARLPADAPRLAALRSPVVVAPLLVVVGAGSVVTLARTRDWRDEMTLFATDVATYPNSSRLNTYLGNMYYYAGMRVATDDPAKATDDFTKAQTYLLRGLAIHDDFLYMDAVLGMAEYRLKEYHEALPHLEKALAFPDYRPQALEMMADAYDQLRQPTDALRLDKQIDAEGIPYPAGWFALGNDAAARGDTAASVRYFEEVVKAAPDNVAGWTNLALGQFRAGAYTDSLGSAEHCLTLQPNQVPCLVAAGEDLGRTGHPDQAAAYLAKAQALVKR